MKAGSCPVRASARATRALRAPSFLALLVSVSLAIPALLIPEFAAPPAGAGENSWSPLGPSGGDIEVLARDPQKPEVLFAGTLVGGLYRSTNGGLHWERVARNLPYAVGGLGFVQITCVAVDPSNSDRVFIGTIEGLFRSTDAGLTVAALPRPLVAGGTFNTLLAIPGRPGELFATNSAFNGYIYRSLDNGETWTLYNQGMLGSVMAVAPDGDALCAVASTGFYRRGTSGNWVRMGNAPPGAVRDLTCTVGGVTYLSNEDGCFVSTNNGAAWTQLATLDFRPVFRIGSDVTGRTFLLGRGRVAKISAGGEPSEVVPTDFPFTPTTGVIVDGDNLLAGTDMGIFRSGDSGASWTPSHEGLFNSDVMPITADPANPDFFYVASGNIYDGAVYKTTDGGQTWSQRGLRLLNTDVRALAVSPADRNILLAGTGNKLDVDGQNGGILKSTDGGLTWRDVTGQNFPDEARLVIDIQFSPDNVDVVYACVVGVNAGFYKSLDGGETWTRKGEGLESMPTTPGIENPFLDYFATLCMAIDPSNPQRIYLAQGGCWGAVNVSVDGGEHWTRKSQDRGTPGLPDPGQLELFDMAIDPTDPNVVYAAGHSDPAVGVYKTTDGGETWTALEPRVTGSFLANGIVMDPLDHQRLFVATRKGVWVTVNGGAHWTPMTEGLPKEAETGRSVFIHPLRPNVLIYSSATAGLFSRSIGPTTPVELVRFAATPGLHGGVTLDWRTTNEIDHAGFHVYREARAVDAAATGRVRVSERLITGSGPDYSFFDATVGPGAWDYHLAEISRSGKTSWHGPISVTSVSAPSAPPAQLSAAPNPFAGRTVLGFTLPSPARARLNVFDVTGRLVTALVDGLVGAGAHDIAWDGRDANGARMPAGNYYARLEVADGTTWTRKVTLSR